MLDKEYFQLGSWKQNLFAFLHSTFNFLLSFVSVGIFPYFILFLLSPGERDFHWNSCSQGPAPMQGQKIIGRPIYPAVLFIFFFFSPPSLLLSPLALDWSWSLQDDSCLLCISIANEIEEKEVELQCVEPQACSLSWERADQYPDQMLPGHCGTMSSWRWDMETAVSAAALTKKIFSRLLNQPFDCIFNIILHDFIRDQWPQRHIFLVFFSVGRAGLHLSTKYHKCNVNRRTYKKICLLQQTYLYRKSLVLCSPLRKTKSETKRQKLIISILASCFGVQLRRWRPYFDVLSQAEQTVTLSQTAATQHKSHRLWPLI